MTPEEHERAEWWIRELNTMYTRKDVQIDHKDCRELRDLLIGFKEEIKDLLLELKDSSN